jgi:hypothetical protein
MKTLKPIRDVVRKLRADGLRVRAGGWPLTLAAERRWDVCYTSDTVVGMNDVGQKAVHAAVEKYNATGR